MLWIEIEISMLEFAALHGSKEQTIADMMATRILNVYLAFEYITNNALYLPQSSNRFDLALCADVGVGGG